MKETKSMKSKLIRRLLVTITFCFLMCLLPLCAHGAEEYVDDNGVTWYYDTPPSNVVNPYPGTFRIAGCSTVPEDGVVEVPASINGTAVTVISNNAFSRNTAIREVVLPEGIKEIGASAFFPVSNLRKINFPSSLVAIGQNAFNSCNLETVEFSDSMNCTVGDGAFRYNYQLETVTINGNVRFEPSAGGTFDGCTSLSAFAAGESCANYTSVDGVLYSKDMKRLEVYPIAKEGSTFVVPDSVETIGAKAFHMSLLTHVTLPETLQEIGNSAFLTCKLLTSIDVPASVSTIGAYSFASCEKLGTVTLHEGLETIGDHAFWDCSRIYELELPNGLTTIGDSAFSVMPNLTKIYIPDSVTEIGSDVFNVTENVTLYTTNETAAAYAQQNGVNCETATVEEYRAVPTGQQHQDPDPGIDPDPGTGNDPGTGTDPGNQDPVTPGPQGPEKILQEQTISCAAIFNQPIGKSFYLNAEAKTPLAYASSNSGVATVTADGLVRVTGYGTCSITIAASKSDTYKAANKTVTISGYLAKPVLKGKNVKKKKAKLTWSKVPGATGYKL